MSKRIFDDMGNEKRPEDSKGKKLGMCGKPGCTTSLACWTDPDYGFICEWCAKNENRMYGKEVCTLAELSPSESTILHTPTPPNELPQAITPAAESFEYIAKNLNRIRAENQSSSDASRTGKTSTITLLEEPVTGIALARAAWATVNMEAALAPLLSAGFIYQEYEEYMDYVAGEREVESRLQVPANSKEVDLTATRLPIDGVVGMKEEDDYYFNGA